MTSAGLPLRTRTALIMPIYNEDTGRVAAGLDVIWRSLQSQAEQGAFDLFILSDTRKPEIAAAEEAAWRALVARTMPRAVSSIAAASTISAAKPATSRTSCAAGARLREHGRARCGQRNVRPHSRGARAPLEKHPHVGIIQALPQPAGRETLFARLIQFGARLNGPMLSSGLAFWQLSEATTGGITPSCASSLLRSTARCRSCRAKRPLGGEILSHDFVEGLWSSRFSSVVGCHFF